jgi:putative transposase
VVRFLLWAILAALKPKALLVAENLCLRQQLLVLQRRQPRPYLKTVDRFFWVPASRWLGGWRNLLLVVKPQTVLKWHQRGWRLYWSWRSRMRPRTGRPAIPQQLQVLIRRMAAENQLWGQKRIQAELARLGFKVSARTVAKYMRTARHDRGPSVRWRTFLKLHASNIWGLRLLLRPDPSVRNASRLLRHPAHQPGSPPHRCHSPPDRRLARATKFSKAVLGIEDRLDL